MRKVNFYLFWVCVIVQLILALVSFVLLFFFFFLKKYVLQIALMGQLTSFFSLTQLNIKSVGIYMKKLCGAHFCLKNILFYFIFFPFLVKFSLYFLNPYTSCFHFFFV